MKRNNKIIDEINRLKSFSGTKDAKYMRNLRMYEWTPGMSLNDMSDAEVVGYYMNNRFDNSDDTTSSIQENVIRSCTDTLVSKIASQKVRPFFSTVNGSFKDMQICKSAQQFFDILYDEQNVNNIVSMAFRDACIFEKGVIFIDRNTNKISRILPWQVYIDPYEQSYGNLTKAAYCSKQYPVSLLPIELKSDAKTVTYWQYWDLNEHKKAYYIPEVDHYEEEEWDPDCLPFVFIYYNNPVKGSTASSIVDLLYGIQMEIDYLNTTIKEATQRGTIQMYFAPENGDLKISNLTNKAGQIITYNPVQGVNTPITSITPPAMDPQWIQLLDKYKADAYELVGISQLSATSQKPKGLNSGIALSTMEDIESDRFETQLNTVIHSYVDIAKVVLQVLEGDILPASKWRRSVDWSELADARNNFSIQFSAAEFLSKDPSVKIQQVQALQQMGQLSQARAGLLLEIPDIQQGYSLANNAMNAVLAVIDDCIEYDIYDVPDYIPIQILEEEIINTQLSLRAASSENKEDIAKLDQLYMACEQKKVNSQTQMEMGITQQLGSALQEQFSQALANGDVERALEGNYQPSLS